MDVFLAHPAENDILIVKDDAVVMGHGVELVGDVTNTIADATSEDRFSIRHLAGEREMRTLPFSRQAVGYPIHLAFDEVVNLCETHSFELPRSPWAHVSLEIPAVDDHRTILVEPCGCLLVKTLERDVDGAGQMFFFVLARRQHLDQLRVSSTNRRISSSPMS